MGIFDIFRTKPNPAPVPVLHQEQKDERKPECPYCHASLAKIPGRKTKCPTCGEFMYVRTRPKDNVRVVVTKKEADKIDEDWAIVGGTYEQYLDNKEAFAQEKEILRKRFGGQEPSDRDVAWGLFNKQLIDHMRNGDWGLYRNTRFGMAELLSRDLKFKHALQTYLEVCYLDLNGASNRGGMNDPELLKEYPPFDLKTAFLAPGMIDIVKRIVERLKMNKDDLRSLFVEHNTRLSQSLKLPLSPDKAWSSIEKALSES